MKNLQKSLHEHIERNQIDGVILDIKNGADINKIYPEYSIDLQEQMTPLQWAIKKRRFEIIEILINHGAYIIQTKQRLKPAEIDILDGVLSEMLCDELKKCHINMNKCLKLLRFGASFNYPETPLLCLMKNFYLLESTRVSVLSELLKLEDLSPETIECLQSNPNWIDSLSQTLYSFIESKPAQKEIYEPYKAYIQKLLSYGARFDIPLPFESPRMFLFDEVIYQLESAFDKAKRLHQDEVLEMMQDSASRPYFSL